MTFLFAEGSTSRFGLKESKLINQALFLLSLFERRISGLIYQSLP